jgi:hypothetical protein
MPLPCAGIAQHVGSLVRIPRAAADFSRPFRANNWFPPFDVVERSPRRYIEVGSGMSTRFPRQAISDLNLQTRIVSIDPSVDPNRSTLRRTVARSDGGGAPRVLRGDQA